MLSLAGFKIILLFNFNSFRLKNRRGFKETNKHFFLQIYNSKNGDVIILDVKSWNYLNSYMRKEY